MMMEALDQALLDDYDSLVDYGSNDNPISMFLALDLEEGIGAVVEGEEEGEREDVGGTGKERAGEGVGERVEWPG